MKRVFIIVLDSVGVGEAPDAANFGDVGAHTMRSISRSPYFKIDNLRRAGLANIDGLDFLGAPKTHTAAVAKMREASAGKDTTIGHWEIAGVYSPTPMPTFPSGFPEEIIDEFEKITGRRALCNKPYSGTEVIKDYGDEHVRTGALIVYTSADSVFQIAAHESVVPLDELYDICRKTRKLLTGKYAVGRVIARPFTGESGNFTRTGNRRDFSLEPTGYTVLDAISDAKLDVISVGKISDIFAARGVTRAVASHNNKEGMTATLALADEDFHGLCFVNLVDFDMLYGHRNDVDGYAKALAEFDAWLPEFTKKLRDDDALIITADHGCDPGDVATDHTREYTPMILIGDRIKPVNLGVRSCFADIAATVADMLGVRYETFGKSYYDEVIK